VQIVWHNLSVEISYRVQLKIEWDKTEKGWAERSLGGVEGGLSNGGF
jgi:hypothetical protein